MKLNSSIFIDRTAEEVWAYMNDTASMCEWQQGYQSTEQLEGEPAEKGSRARHTYRERGKPFIMTETVLDSRPPYSIKIVLEHPAMAYEISTRLCPDSPGRTLVQMESKVSLKAFSFKILSPLLKSPFQKRQDKDLKRLKKVLEAQ